MNVNPGKDRLSRACPIRTDHGLMKATIHSACDTILIEDVHWAKQSIESKFELQKQIELVWGKTSEAQKGVKCPTDLLLEIAQTYWKNSINRRSLFFVLNVIHVPESLSTASPIPHQLTDLVMGLSEKVRDLTKEIHTLNSKFQKLKGKRRRSDTENICLSVNMSPHKKTKTTHPANVGSPSHQPEITPRIPIITLDLVPSMNPTPTPTPTPTPNSRSYDVDDVLLIRYSTLRYFFIC